MIPVEQIHPGDVVTLPNGREMPVARVERYDDQFVVVYRDGDLEKTLRIMRAGDLVNAARGDGLPSGIDDQFGDDRETERLALLEIYRRAGPLTDSELVEHVREREADAGLPLTEVSRLMRRRRELERRQQIELRGSRRHVESGAVEPLWAVPENQPTQQTIADAFYPEPDL